MDGVRWWNVRHPAAYAQRLRAGRTPAAAREVLSEAERHTEDVLLRLRLREGLPVGQLEASALPVLAVAVADGLVEPESVAAGRAVLTRRGRLLADDLVRRMLA
jgi:oxygen-independent coproporphyrinogen-3 oxidase